MFFQQRAAANATLSYFFGCAGKARAVAVDVVAGDEEWFVSQAEKAGVRIAYVLDTHVHADHYSGGPELARRSGAPYCVHERNKHRLSFEFEALRDGQRLEVGNVLVDVMHTPGHTAGSACGAGLSGKPVSTIAFERRHNRMLSLSRQAFVEALLADRPPQPADMARIVEANLRGTVPQPFGA